MEIFNTKYSSKKGSASNNYIRTPLINSQRLIPSSDFFGVVDEVEVYNEERKNCDKIRLIVTINPICSNVLFNRITEVVYKEGSDEAQCINFNNDALNNSGDIKIYYKGKDNFKCEKTYGALVLTRDTQLSCNEAINYKCGIDIFNNHLLRNRSFKAVCQNIGGVGNEADFNTLFDYLRDSNGYVVEDYVNNGTNVEPIHLYRTDEVLQFDESVDKNLIEENGWLGFINANNPTTYYYDNVDRCDKPLKINRVINNEPPCAFIDMCPSRDLFYFTPKYNTYRNRYEKNWHYYLTYPSSSTKSESKISFIREKTNSLKVYYFDDTEKLGGLTVCKIVSISKHGLQVNDVINLYVNGTSGSTEDTIIYGLQVVKVDNEYTFYVKYSQQNWFETNFLSWNGKKIEEADSGGEWKMGENYIYNTGYPNDHIPIFVKNKKYVANFSLTSNKVSFKQVVNGQEVEYYVRIFSRLPNWRFSKEKLTQYLTEDERKEIIKSAQTCDFESHLSKLAFAKNIYGDDISQIVFTDDIQINDLTDNLGRPLTDIYLTIIKNNAGYKEWYGKNNTAPSPTSDTVEFSHVFGKVSCAFKLSDESVWDKDYKNAIVINGLTSEDSQMGFRIDESFRSDATTYDSDEILTSDISFYGDLCLFSPATLAEKTIDDIWYRFNTAQRELIDTYRASEYLDNVVYEEILGDDYDSKGFHGSSAQKIRKGNIAHEGYIYNPHYKIPIKSFSKELQTQKAHTVGIVDILLGDNDFTVMTDLESYIEPSERFVIHNVYRDEYYECQSTADSYITNTKFKFRLTDDTDTNKLFDGVKSYIIIKRQEIVPMHAVLLKDNSYRYAWREIFQNGFDEYSDNEVYPFTNGALYIEKYIRLYCQRQDKDGVASSLFKRSGVLDVEPSKFKAINKDNYIEEEDITCF